MKRLFGLIVCVFLLPLNSMFQAYAQPSGYVVYRIDDIQSNWLVHVQIALLNQFLLHNIKASLAIIPANMNGHGTLYQNIKQGVNNQLFEIDAHGWKHIDYSKLDAGTQYSTMADAKRKLTQLFGVRPQVFIPPYNEFNTNTVIMSILLGYNVFSANRENELAVENIHDFRFNSLKEQKSLGNIFRIPQMASFMEMPEDKWIKVPIDILIENSTAYIKKYGYVVITLHPQNFAKQDKKGNFIDIVDKKQMGDLVKLMKELESNNITAVHFSDISSMAYQTQYGRSDVLMGKVPRYG